MRVPDWFRAKGGTNLDWWIANQAEYRALSDAEDGNPFPLAEIVEQSGVLQTHEARHWIGARLRGEKLKQGQKRTISQQAHEVGVLGYVREIMKEHRVKEHRAI